MPKFLLTVIIFNMSFVVKGQFNGQLKYYETSSRITTIPPDSFLLNHQYIQCIHFNLSKIKDSSKIIPFYNIAAAYSLSGKSDSAFIFLDYFMNYSKDDRMIIIDENFFPLKNDTLKWNSVIRRIENAYFDILDSVSNPGLALELFYLGINDQLYRTYYPMMKPHYEFTILESMRNDEVNREKLVKIFKQYGFPTISMVGKLASRNAFLILQHFRKIPKKYYIMVQNAFLNNDIEPQIYALVTDRYKMDRNQKQIYGTQIFTNNKVKRKYGGNAILWPVKDFKNVDRRRKSLGFTSTVEEYVSRFPKSVIPDHYYRK